ncbi:uncharacterized protein LOC110891574 [Helianthus annuus]|uniref:uncharacterized protein LOC110891574 n=1 Tax=Helianthus annuus TaxID=4232 RepID=UPI001652F93C|nr:uncharacterized protein LOC110891574 [Helianthus annuus]
MKKAGNPFTNRAAIKKLLDSLPKEWSLQCMMIKKDLLNNPNPVTLSDLINTLRAFEMDVNKREMNTAGYPPKSTQTSAGLKNVAFLASGGITPQASDLIYSNVSASASKAPQPSEKTISVGDTQALKVSTENVALFNMFLSSFEALMSGELKKEMLTAEDMYQNLGHFKRDCPLLKEGNSETTPAVKQITVEENKSNASPSTPKALVIEDYDWSEEIAETKEQVNKALMAKISSESSLKQFKKQTVGIPKGDNVVDKGLKSILTSVEPENEKKCGEAEEHVSKEASDQKKGKEKVPAAAMKADSSKEKADKDLVNSIPLSFKEKLCTPACVDVVAHYKSLNLEFERQKDKALKVNNELKQNKAAYQRKKNNVKDESNNLSRMDDCNGRVPKFKSSDDYKGHVPTFETRDHEHCVSECHDLNYAFCDDKVVCESPVFVPELKRNSFGKFLTEEIPEFIPSRTGMTDSEKNVTEDHGNEDSSTAVSENEQRSESSSEDQTTSSESLESSSEDQPTNDESFECSSSETIEDQDSESSNKDQSYNESSYEAREEQSSSEDNTSESSFDSERHTAKHCKTKKFSKPEHDFLTNVTYQNKLQKWLRMLMEYIWHVDSGCSRHMTGLKELLKNFRFIDGDFVSFAGDEKGGMIVGVRDVVSEALTLENVNYVPELCYNLMSVSQVCDKGISVLFNDMECLFLKPGYVVPAEMIMLTAPRQNNTYVLNMKNPKINDNLTFLISKAAESESLLWHRRLGHVNFKNMNKLSKLNLVRGLPIKEFPFSEKYDFSRFSWVYFLEAKSETAEVLKSFILLIENVTKLKVKSIRSDNGSEFKNQTFISFCAEKGIHLQYSAARTPQQNGVAERKNRTLIEAARTMLVDSKLPIIFWAEAVNTACYVLNRVLIVKPHGKTAYELLFKRKPLIDFFRPFGCSCTLLNTQENLIKFEAVGDICYFMGYSSTQKAYRVYNKRTKIVIKSYYVDFQEGNYTNTGSTPDWFYDVGVIFNTFEIPEVVSETEPVEDTQVEPLFDSSDIGLTPFTTRLSPSTADPILAVNEATGTVEEGVRTRAQSSSINKGLFAAFLSQSVP